MVELYSFAMTASHQIIEVKCSIDFKAISSYRECVNPITGELDCTHVTEFGGFNYAVKLPYNKFKDMKLTYDFGFNQN